MYTKVEPYIEPIDIFTRLGERASELSDVDLGFIGGIIRDLRPRKIVEVGVSAGGTTAFILNCIDKLDLNSDMWSVDVSHTYHLDRRKACGFQIEPAMQLLSRKRKHHLVLGKNIAQILPTICPQETNKRRIGGDIDLFILDTTHYLPGELLDFIVCLPFLSENAVVICDDLYFWNDGENRAAFATRILYSVATVQRLLPAHNEGPTKMAGMQVDEQTSKYVANLFEGLSMPWDYTLDSAELKIYRDLIAMNYLPELLEKFDEAVAVNKEASCKMNNIKRVVSKLLELFSDGKPVYIFGAGSRGQALMRFMRDRGLKIKGFVISPGQGKERFDGIGCPVFYLDELTENSKERHLILAVADPTARDTLDNNSCEYVEAPNYIFPFIKQYVNLLC